MDTLTLIRVYRACENNCYVSAKLQTIHEKEEQQYSHEKVNTMIMKHSLTDIAGYGTHYIAWLVNARSGLIILLDKDQRDA